MNYLLLITGMVLVLFALADFSMTALIPTKEGKISQKISRGVYHVFFHLAGKKGENPILDYLGFTIIVCICFSWIFLCWLGFTLIFLSDPDSIINTTDLASADLWEKLYFAGFAFSTLGTGDFVANSDGWRVFTAFTSIIGIVLITMSITYLVPVVSNMIQKRSLSLYITALGESSEQIVINSFNGKDFKELSSQFSTLAEMILRYSQNHLAYPILHYVHNANPHENIILQLTNLDEALTVFLFHIPEEIRPSTLNLQLVRRAITNYLKTLSEENSTEKDPPLPDFEEIQRHTIITLINTEADALKRIYTGLSQRRRLLYGVLRMDGWQWNQLQGEKYKTHLDLSPANI